MKWFKHISDSLDDPFIFELLARFGPAGYLVFFGTLEVLSREFKIDSPGISTIFPRFLTKKLQLSRKKTKEILKFCDEKNRIFFCENRETWTLKCPKLKDLCDEYTRKEIKEKSGQTPDNIQINSCTEKEVDLLSTTDLSIVQKDQGIGPDGPQPDGWSDLEKEILEEIKTIIPEFQKRFNNFETHKWLNKMLKEGRHPGGIRDALKNTLKVEHPPKNKNLWPYLTAIVNKYSGNYNEMEYRKKVKNLYTEAASLKDIFAMAGMNRGND